MMTKARREVVGISEMLDNIAMNSSPSNGRKVLESEDNADEPMRLRKVEQFAVHQNAILLPAEGFEARFDEVVCNNENAENYIGRGHFILMSPHTETRTFSKLKAFRLIMLLILVVALTIVALKR